MFRRLLTVVMVLSVFFSTSIFTQDVFASPALNQPGMKAAFRVVDLVNEQRAAAGLAPVQINAVLMAEAYRFSTVQADLGTLSHRGVDGTNAGQRLTQAGYRWSFYGENLAAGQPTVSGVVAAWMASPPHRAIILAPQATEIGIGHTVRTNDPANYVDYWVLEVGRPR